VKRSTTHRRPVAQKLTVSLSDIANDALEELLPIAGRGMANDAATRRWLVNAIVEEGLFALADRLEATGRFRFVLRFDVCAEGERRGIERERNSEQIDAVLRNAEREAAV